MLILIETDNSWKQLENWTPLWYKTQEMSVLKLPGASIKILDMGLVDYIKSANDQIAKKAESIRLWGIDTKGTSREK